MVILDRRPIWGYAVAMILSFVARPSFAQQDAFEVISIKPSQPGPAGGPPRVAADGRRFIAANATVRMLLQFAYPPGPGKSLRNADIVGPPAWADAERFNIEAKAEDGGPPITRDQMQRMVQALLSDRFQLKAHWEKRDNVEIYNLVAAKDGLKLKPSDDQTIPQVGSQPAAAANPTALPPRGQIRTIANPSTGSILLTVSGASIPIVPDLVNALQGYAGRPIVDRTGLTGLFDFRVQFVLDASGPSPGPNAAPVASEPSGVSLFSALQEQLGLKLESSKGTVDVLIIDSIQKPSEN
jgi:uncharacterized protein (TIGR03435 family)